MRIKLYAKQNNDYKTVSYWFSLYYECTMAVRMKFICELLVQVF